MSVGSHLNTFSLALFVVAYALLVIFALAMYPVSSGAAMLPLVDDPQFLYGQPDARVVITVARGSDGWVPDTYWIGNRKFTREGFLRAMVTHRPGSTGRVLLRADARLRIGDVLTAAEALGSAGYEHVFLCAYAPLERGRFALLSPAWVKAHTVD